MVRTSKDLFFNFGDFDEEILKKFSSLEIPARVLAEQFVNMLRVEKVFSATDVSQIEALLSSLGRISLQQSYPNYLSHPIRVAAAYVRIAKEKSCDWVSLALCHNIREVYRDVDLSVLDSYLSVDAHLAISALTIDRDREQDPKYLSEYYRGIKEHSAELVLLKALDKLDNILWWPNFRIESHQVLVVKNYVLPLLQLHHVKLAQYLEELIPYVLLNSTKQKFEHLITENGAKK